MSESPHKTDAALPAGQPWLMRHLAPAVLQRYLTRVRAFDTLARDASIADWHRYRMAVRQLRTVADLLRDALPDGLRAAGASVDVVPLYRTVAELPEGVDAPAADLVTFTSSSTARAFAAAFPDADLAAVRGVSIGPITSATMRELGIGIVAEAIYAPHIPEQPGYVIAVAEPTDVREEGVLVVGGGNSACGAAVALSAPELGNRVTLSYRGQALRRVAEATRAALASRERGGRLRVLLGSEVAAIEPDGAVIARGGERTRETFDRIYVMIGGTLPGELLRAIGIRTEIMTDTREEVLGYMAQSHSDVVDPFRQQVY